METKSFSCPSCGGKLTYDARERKLICVSCNNTYTAKDLMKIDKSIDDTIEFEADYFKNEDNTTEYTCTSCGGAIIVEDSIASSVCPFCGNNVLLKNSLAGTYRPKYIVPFLNSKDQIEEIKKHYLNKNPFLPFGFKEAVNKTRVNDLYIPLYVLRGKVAFDLSIAGKLEMAKLLLNDNQLDDSFQITLFGAIQFHHFPLHALRHDYDDTIQAIGPFDLKNIKQFDTPYLAGHIAKRLEIPFNDLKDHASTEIENGIKKHLQNPAILKKIYMESGSLEKNAEENETLSVSNVHITKMSSSYTFYSMWFIEPTFKNKKYSIIINDQNGAIFGNIPLSKPKLALFSIIFFALFEQILYWVLFLMNKNWLISLIVSIFMGMIITIITMVSLYLQNYSYKKPIKDYVVPNSCNLSNKRDEKEKKEAVRGFEEQMEALSLKITEQGKLISKNSDEKALAQYQRLLTEYQGLVNISSVHFTRVYEEEKEKVKSYSQEELENLIRCASAEKSACSGRLRTGKITKEYYDILVKHYDQRIELYKERLKSLTE